MIGLTYYKIKTLNTQRKLKKIFFISLYSTILILSVWFGSYFYFLAIDIKEVIKLISLIK
jgi:hypothetical protein